MNKAISQTKVNYLSDRSPHPIVFLFLNLPYGIFTGYLTVTLAFLFSKSGISIIQIAGLAAINLIPQIFKFLWAPLVDVSLSLKKWHVISVTVTSLCILATGIVPIKASSLPFISLMIIISSFARTFIGAATGGLAAHDTPMKMKGRVGGYIQSGHLGGSAIGGGAGLWLSQHTPHIWIAGMVLAFTCFLCCTGLYFVQEPSSTVRVKTIAATFNNVLKDVWLTIKTKLGLLALLLCIVPLATGAAGNLFAAIAKDWGAGAGVVALATGITGGIVTIGGCLAGGWLSDIMNRQRAYVYFGLAQAVAAFGMAFCPHTALMYIIWTLIYAFISGLEYTAFSAFVLEATGKGAAATKYELYNGVSWSPIYMMIWIEGLAYTKWGANGMLKTEAWISILAALLFVAIQAVIRKNKPVGAERQPVTLPA